MHKFGGTSVGTPERVAKVADIVRGLPGRRAVVVSAFAGVTDGLLSLLALSAAHDVEAKQSFGRLVQRHQDAARALLPAGAAQSGYLDTLEREARDVEDVVRSAFLLRHAAEDAVEFVAGHGELWSARLLAAHLEAQGQTAAFIDARTFLTVEQTGQGPTPDWEKSHAGLAPLVEGADVVVITGFIARTADGRSTTLKRNGSDLSASIVGNLLDAAAVTIWTDVDGVLTADPRKVPEAVVTPHLSYAEAAELAYFGAKVLHPHTMAPAIEKSIPILIKNTLRPGAEGSRIGPAAAEHDAERPVRGFASVDDVALINVEGKGMMGVPGVAERLFRALSDGGINVILISQASSEHSICVAVPQLQAESAKALAERAFLAELRLGHIEAIDAVGPCSILAAVGDAMGHVPGVAGRFLGALGKAGVNAMAVAQGSSERNISVVVKEADAEMGLRAAHAAFYLSDQTISVGIVGPGLIGRTLLTQIHEQRTALREQLNIDLRVRAIVDSKHMLLSDDHIDLSSWRAALDQAEPIDADRFLHHLAAPHIPHRVIVDCTASDSVAARTPVWLGHGLHVVTPNKKARAGARALVTAIDDARERTGAHYFYEATVGAGLPVLSTLRELKKTGDAIASIEGILSGTLSYLFNTYDGATSFSALVAQAREQGFTEPDPRDDLSGMDVARKVTILGREMGLDLDIGDVAVESLVPASLRDAPDAETFLSGLAAFDDEMKARYDAAQKEGGVLRYVGRISADGQGSVKLMTLPAAHAFARVTGSDNIIAFTTKRYRSQPLIVQGPGAGPEVTAGGVFADLLRLAAHLGSRS